MSEEEAFAFSLLFRSFCSLKFRRPCNEVVANWMVEAKTEFINSCRKKKTEFMSQENEDNCLHA